MLDKLLEAGLVLAIVIGGYWAMYAGAYYGAYAVLWLRDYMFPRQEMVLREHQTKRTKVKPASAKSRIGTVLLITITAGLVGAVVWYTVAHAANLYVWVAAATLICVIIIFCARCVGEVNNMPTLTDAPISVGKRHRTTKDLRVWVYNYDRLTPTEEILPAGAMFQPWEPAHWRGEEVPITLGGGATEFDWGVTAANGHFLAWEDFFASCELAELGEVDMDQIDPKEYAEWLEEEYQRRLHMEEIARKLGTVGGKSHKVPKLNPDGSLAGPEEDDEQR
jgi:hypothetical protein